MGKRTIIKGVKYLYDEKGIPQVVQIDLRQNRQLWEDLQDLYVIDQRRNEPRESLDEVKSLLEQKRKRTSKK